MLIRSKFVCYAQPASSGARAPILCSSARPASCRCSRVELNVCAPPVSFVIPFHAYIIPKAQATLASNSLISSTRDCLCMRALAMSFPVLHRRGVVGGGHQSGRVHPRRREGEPCRGARTTVAARTPGRLFLGRTSSRFRQDRRLDRQRQGADARCARLEHIPCR